MTHVATRHHTCGPDPMPNKTVLCVKWPFIAALDKNGLSVATTWSCLNASRKSRVRNSMLSPFALLSIGKQLETLIDKSDSPCHSIHSELHQVVFQRDLRWWTRRQYCLSYNFSPFLNLSAHAMQWAGSVP